MLPKKRRSRIVSGIPKLISWAADHPTASIVVGAALLVVAQISADLNRSVVIVDVVSVPRDLEKAGLKAEAIVADPALADSTLPLIFNF